MNMHVFFHNKFACYFIMNLDLSIYAANTLLLSLQGVRVAPLIDTFHIDTNEPN